MPFNFSEMWTTPFSIVANLEKLIQVNEDQAFSVVHFLKFISIIMVITGHRVMQFLGNVILNPQFTEIVSCSDLNL